MRSGMGSSPDHDLAQHGEIGMGQHGERDVAVPAGPGANLVLVEADLAPMVEPRPLRAVTGAQTMSQPGGDTSLTRSATRPNPSRCALVTART